jgi:hypothetical protein
MSLTDLKMLNLIIGLFEHEKIKYEPINDDAVLYRHLNGIHGPSGMCGVYAMPGTPLQEVITDIYEAVEFIEKHGLRRL